MKISIEIDCTPEEARSFLGLPDVAPMQEALMEELQKRMIKALGSMDPEGMEKGSNAKVRSTMAISTA